MAYRTPATIADARLMQTFGSRLTRSVAELEAAVANGSKLEHSSLRDSGDDFTRLLLDGAQVGLMHGY